MNVYDSHRMKDVLAPLGYAPSAEADGADMVIINTCHIREKAAEKLYSELGRLRKLKQAREVEGQSTILAVAGCVAQAEGAEIVRRAPYVDIVLGPQTYHRLPEMIARATRASEANNKPGNKPGKGSGVLDIEFPAEPKFDHLPEISVDGVSAFLSVQEGCDKFCTFCVVPYTRGAEFSRPGGAVLAEAQGMVDKGVKEITLLGQNVNAYHADTGLAGLIRQLAEIDGLERIRYTTSHPADMDDDLIAVHGEVEKLPPFLHLPVQSGSDRVLAAMNRRHTIAEYRHTIDKLRVAQSKLKLSSDFIVGFPGESDKDFEATALLARELGFIQAYSFKYSPRPGTPGAMMGNQVPEEVKSERLAQLQEILTDNQNRFNQSCIDQVMPVLIDRPGRKDGQFAGRSPYMQPVHVTLAGRDADDVYGQIVDLRITDAGANSLTGTLVSKAVSLDNNKSPGANVDLATEKRINA